MDENAKKHGAFSWNELLTTDPEGAKKFYSELFGWETIDYPMEGMNYTVLKVNGKETGGLMQMPTDCDETKTDCSGTKTDCGEAATECDDTKTDCAEMPADCGEMRPAWNIYVTVDDVDATAAQVEGLGGKVLRPPMDIPEVGRLCVLSDPQGAVLCAITYVEGA